MLLSKSAYTKSSLWEIPQQVFNKPWLSSHPNSNPRFGLSNNHLKLKLIFSTPSPVTQGGQTRNFISHFLFFIFLPWQPTKTQAHKTHHLKYHRDVIYPGWLPISQPPLPQSGSRLAFTNHVHLADENPSITFFFLGPQTIYSQGWQCRFKDWD